jgi:vitamin K-dependent gamma-carboxylase
MAIDPASLAAFRILFGVVMAVSTLRFMALGWIDEFFVQPRFHFTWELFPWMAPLPPPLMYVLFVALVALAIGIAVGYHYRICAALFFLGFTYVELIDKTTYLNHYYLVSLLSGLLAVMPDHRTALVPAWTVNLLRFQLAVVYIFAGLAKINSDWLLDAQPLRLWLAARSDLPIVGALLSEPWVAYAFSWFGAAYDLTIVGFLLWSRTRAVAYVTVVVFHLMTAVLFPIGMFPWIMIAATTIFFPPDWPRRWLRLKPDITARMWRPASAGPRQLWRPALAGPILLYTVMQIALPLRAYWPGADPEWTGRGFNFSWRVMLAEKSGFTEFSVDDPTTGQHWRVQPREIVTARQELMMGQDPYMVRALARYIADDYRARGIANVRVHAESFVTLNGRAAQRLIDPTIDLAAPSSAEWIVPFKRVAE